MAEETDNLTIRLLQELRSDLRELRGEVTNMRAEMTEMRTDLTQRVEGNTLVFNLVAGVVHDHERRIGELEAGKSS